MQLKQNGLIDNAIVSFSTAGPGEPGSFAIFGGLDPNQIVGGVQGLHKMQTLAYRPDWTESVKQWAIEAKGIYYGNEEFLLSKGSFPAIIDTGSSNLGIPHQAFVFLKENWKKTVPDLDCVIDDNFCQSLAPCEAVAKNISSFSVTLGDQVFEMNPELFLHQAVEDTGSRC
jgi:hypothetical protein